MPQVDAAENKEGPADLSSVAVEVDMHPEDEHMYTTERQPESLPGEMEDRWSTQQIREGERSHVAPPTLQEQRRPKDKCTRFSRDCRHGKAKPRRGGRQGRLRTGGGDSPGYLPFCSPARDRPQHTSSTALSLSLSLSLSLLSQSH